MAFYGVPASADDDEKIAQVVEEMLVNYGQLERAGHALPKTYNMTREMKAHLRQAYKDTHNARRELIALLSELEAERAAAVAAS